MNNIWLYTIKDQAKGIVIASSEREAIEKVLEAYKKHGDNICYEEVMVTHTTDADGWKCDSPDVLEAVDLSDLY